MIEVEEIMVTDMPGESPESLPLHIGMDELQEYEDDFFPVQSSAWVLFSDGSHWGITKRFNAGSTRQEWDGACSSDEDNENAEYPRKVKGATLKDCIQRIKAAWHL